MGGVVKKENLKFVFVEYIGGIYRVINRIFIGKVLGKLEIGRLREIDLRNWFWFI